MKREHEVREAYENVAQIAEELDEENPFEAIAPIILLRGFRWVLGEEEQEEGDLLEQIREDAEEILEEG